MASAHQAVLLLHGQPGSSGDWRQVQAAIGPRARTVAVDRPGWDGARRAANLDGNARAAVAALDAAGLEKATVVGHSFGGGVAAWMAVHHPERVGRLVLVAPSANTASLFELDRMLAAPVLGDLASAATLGTAGIALSAASLGRRLTGGGARANGYLRSQARRLLSPAAWAAFSFEQRVLIRDLPVLEAQLGRIAAPTVIVAGTRDIVVPLSAQRALAASIPRAQLRLIARAGHLLPLRQAGALAEIILGA